MIAYTGGRDGRVLSSHYQLRPRSGGWHSRIVDASVEGKRIFAELLREHRLAADLTQEALAERAAMSERTIRSLERGANRPQKDTAHRIAAALGLRGEALAHFVAAAMPAPRRRSSPSTRGPGSLPMPPTTLLGREDEVAAVTALLGRDDLRLITLTGAGGVGKTRLALEVATLVQDRFSDGAVFVPLAPLSGPHLVLPTVARVLGLPEYGGQSIETTLLSYLHGKDLLLWLDNFEHLLDAAVDVAALLAACAGLRILVTSRAPLRLRGEHVYPVPPLRLPESLVAGHSSPAAFEVLADVAAVRLFVERARAAKPAFALSPVNAWPVAQICTHLDGLPLAIELAAARSAILSPQALLVRLTHPLRVLTGGARDLPERQRTLRNTVAWSYDLLPPAEQRLFQRLAVFRAGCELEAIEAVCAEDLPIDPLEGVSSLVEKHLVVAGDDEDTTRFRMLETVREYALERLHEGGEADVVRRHHLSYYLVVAEASGPGIRGPEVGAWARRIERELDNFRSALSWSRDSGDIESYLRLSAALFYFCQGRGYRQEGRGWLEGALALASPSNRTRARAEALAAAGGLGILLGDFHGARQQLEESVTIWREVGDAFGLAFALTYYSIVLALTGDGVAAGAAGEETLRIAREAGDHWHLGLALHGSGVGVRDRGDFTTARALYDESLSHFRAIGAKPGIALVVNSLGDLARLQRRYRDAATYYEESLELAMDMTSKQHQAMVLHNLGHATQRLRDTDEARRCFRESLLLFRELGDIPGTAECVAGLAGTAVDLDPELAVRLFAAAVQAAEGIGIRLSSNNQPEYDCTLVVARQRLGDEQLEAAWSRGRAMGLEQAILDALQDIT